jgi:hypothetical protein
MRRLQVIFEEIHIDDVGGPAVFPPKLVPRELHGIKVLWNLALPFGQRFMMTVSAMVNFDGA